MVGAGARSVNNFVGTKFHFGKRRKFWKWTVVMAAL